MPLPFFLCLLGAYCGFVAGVAVETDAQARLEAADPCRQGHTWVEQPDGKGHERCLGCQVDRWLDPVLEKTKELGP